MSDLTRELERVHESDDPWHAWNFVRDEYSALLAAQRDAERYRWLRVHFEFANDSMREIWFDSHIKHYSPQQDGVAEELDKAIDDEIAYGLQRSKPPVDDPAPGSTGLIDAAIKEKPL